MTDEERAVPNSADPKQVKKGKQKAEIKKTRLMDDYRHVLECPQGRRVLWDIMSFAHVFRDIVGSNSETHRALGQRKVGLHVISRVNEADETKYIKMQVEARERKERGE